MINIVKRVPKRKGKINPLIPFGRINLLIKEPIIAPTREAKQIKKPWKIISLISISTNQ
jgi:hypothetical protein